MRRVCAHGGALLVTLALALIGAVLPSSAAAAPVGGRFQIRHVFVLVLENESASVTFGANSPAPYLATTLRSRGAFLPHYYGVGHSSLDNYIAMISGQAPNEKTQADCGVFADFPAGPLGSYGQEPGTGCVYPTDVATVAAQLTAAGDTWRDYNQGMGADPSREAATCGHPAIGSPDNTEAATADRHVRHPPRPVRLLPFDHRPRRRCAIHTSSTSTSLPQDLAERVDAPATTPSSLPTCATTATTLPVPTASRAA